jgi:hypothetical protein
MQKVSFGVTQSGTPGLFTNGVLAYGLSDPAQRKAFEADPVGYCKRLRFEFTTEREAPPQCTECKQPLHQSHATACPYGGLPR